MRALRFFRIFLILSALPALAGCTKKESSSTGKAPGPGAPANSAKTSAPGEAAGAAKEKKHGDVETFDIGRGVKLEVVYLEGGTFQMGSPQSEQDQAVKDGAPADAVRGEGPVHEIVLDGFSIGKFEVTQEQYQAVVGSNPSHFKDPKNPVEQVTWNDATQFCKLLSQKTGQTFRLPTEAEWEYACRAGSKTRFCFGDSDGDLGDYAWYNGNSGSQTHPAGQKKPNAWGLYDTHGNIWEWCLDWYGEAYYAGSPRKNPQPTSGQYRVLRGGAWSLGPRSCRSAYRYGSLPTYTYSSQRGFRVVAFPGELK